MRVYNGQNIKFGSASYLEKLCLVNENKKKNERGGI